MCHTAIDTWYCF